MDSPKGGGAFNSLLFKNLFRDHFDLTFFSQKGLGTKRTWEFFKNGILDQKHTIFCTTLCFNHQQYGYFSSEI